MKITASAIILIASSLVAALPSENETMMKVRALQKRHFGESRLHKRESANLSKFHHCNRFPC
jgi:hypothetical protein